MKKTYLLSYKPTMFQALNTGFTFELTLEIHKRVWLFFKSVKIQKSTYEVPAHDHRPLSVYTDNWDQLIKQHKPLK